MRIAIQLFGHLRTFEDTYKALLKNVINNNRKKGIEFDIFLHSWDEEDSMQTGSYKKSKKFMGKKFSLSTLDKVKDYYKPKGYLISEQLIFDDDDKTFMQENDVSENSFAMIKNVSFSMMKVNQLREEYEKENNIKYDFIIMTRPDILFMKKLDLSQLKNNQCRGAGTFDKDFLENSLLTSYIISDFSGQIMKQDFYLCGVDLLAMMSPKLASEIGAWHFKIKEKAFAGLYPERSLTKISKDNNITHNYIGYEKDKCWIILRNNFYYMKSPYFAPLRFFFNCLFDIVKIPLLFSSLKFRQMTMCNPHFLERKHFRALKKFLK